MAKSDISSIDDESNQQQQEQLKSMCLRKHVKSQKLIASPSLRRHFLLSIALFSLLSINYCVQADGFNGFISGPILNSSLQFTSLALPDDSLDEAIVSDESLPQPAALRLDNEDDESKANLPEISLPTVTVRGFLNFRTTVDGTVVVFTSSSSMPSSTSAVAVVAATSKPPAIVPSSTYTSYSSRYNGNDNEHRSSSPVYSRVFDLPLDEEAFKTSSSIEPTSVSSSYSPVYPTGLVTILAETELGNNGETTVQETKVIGTYIEGKYAQILKSTSFVNSKSTLASSSTPTPSFTRPMFAVYPSDQVSSSSSPSDDRSQEIPVSNGESKFKFKFDSLSKEEGDSVTRFTRGDRSPPLFALSRPSLKSSSSNSPKSTDKVESTVNSESTSATSPAETPRVKIRKIGRLGQNSSRFTWTPRASEKVRLNRFKVKVTSDSPASSPQSRFTARDENEKEAAKLLNARLNRRLGTPRSINPDKVVSNTASSSSLFTQLPEALVLDREFSGESSEMSSSPKKQPAYNNAPLEGLLSENSSPPVSSSSNDRPVNIKASRVVVETITYTSDITRGFEGGEPLIDKVTLTNLVDKTVYLEDLPAVSESLVQPTLLEGNIFMGAMVTPPIVLSHIYEVTSSTSRTSLLPVSDSMVTVTDNFIVKQLVTAYKTLPNSLAEASDLLSSLISDMNNSAYFDPVLSRVNNQIEITNSPSLPGAIDSNIDLQAAAQQKAINTLKSMPSNDGSLQLLPSIGNSPIGPQIDLNNPLILGAALQNPNLAAMYFGLQQLSQQVTQYTTIFKSTEVPSTETIYATKTISFYDGRQTRTRTITEPASTSIRLVSTVTPQVQPVINPQVLVQQAQLQRAFASQLLNSQSNSNSFANNNNNNNIFGNNNGNNGNNALAGLLSNLNNQQQQLQQQQSQQNNQFNINNLPLPSVPQVSPSTVTETSTTVITTTSTSSKIYTLIYNAFSTKYRTVTSTTVFPTQVVTTVTKTITPTANYNSFFG